MTCACYQFGDFDLDCERFELRRKGIPLRLERQPMELLILLATAHGRLVSRDEIARRLWPSEVFVDTEHGINTAIRKIRYALREDADSPRFLQTVTGKGYRLVGVTAPEPVATPSAAHALPAATGEASLPQAIARQTSALPTPFSKPEKQDPPPVSALETPASPARRLWMPLAALAVLGLGIFLGLRTLHARNSRSSLTSLAVLPLDNLTGDASQNYLADGLTDELTTQLARDSRLRVISRTSVMQYRGAHRPLPEIARSLNVDGIIEGSLTRAAGGYHVTLQLINAPADSHLWAQSYDRSAADLLTLPEEAALTIASATHSADASSAPQRYINPTAHDAYLRGHYLWYTSNEVASGQYFLKAVRIQPDYTLAWAGLVGYYGAGMVDGDLDPRLALAPTHDAALKAMHIDDSLPEAHWAMAGSLWIVDWDLNGALRELDRAIELNPRYTEAHHVRAKILGQLNRHDEAIAEQRIAMELNPFERPWSLAFFLLRARRFDAAIADAKQRLEGRPDATMWHVISKAYAAKGMEKESEHALEQSVILCELCKGQPLADEYHRAFAQGGKRAVLLLQLKDEKAESQRRYVSPYAFALLYAQLGDRRQALAFLDESLLQHSPMILDIQNDTEFDSLHADPHYRAIVRKVGLPPAW